MDSFHAKHSLTAHSGQPSRAASSDDPARDSVVRIILNLGDAGHAVGSGFVVAGPGGPSVITAFHSLSGGVCLRERLRAKTMPPPMRGSIRHGAEVIAEFPLYQRGISIFLRHPAPERANWCDVACIPFDTLTLYAVGASRAARFWSLPGIDLPRVDDGATLVDDMAVPVGKPVLLYGYPGGRDFWGAPIGVSATIAAHAPERSFLLISGDMDMGCSGAPAMAREFGGYMRSAQDGPQHVASRTPIVDQWLGMYSGRLYAVDAARQVTQHETSVGVVWTPETIRDVITDGVPDVL
ncbi:hypothetical protein ACI3L3_10690 [Desulfobaculum sp. SPO524]|uniref:hypothetical protein n=1 Tax=Desulfobaculum sp. SPO524 TaxID=3378071 RepID=UPI0038523104